MSENNLRRTYLRNCCSLLSWRQHKKLSTEDITHYLKLLTEQDYVCINLGSEYIILFENMKMSITNFRKYLERAKKQIKDASIIMIIMNDQEKTDTASANFANESSLIFSETEVHIYDLTLVTFTQPLRPDFHRVRLLSDKEKLACEQIFMSTKMASIPKTDPALVWNGGFPVGSCVLMEGPSLNAESNMWYRYVRN